MARTVYLETSIISYLAARPSRDLVTAAVHSIDFLLTWNSTHIANAELRPIVEQACRDSGYTPPILCTPDELMGG